MLPRNVLEKISFTQSFLNFPRVGRPARLLRARVSLITSGIRQAGPLALQKKGFTTALLPPFWGAICSPQMEGQSSDCPGRAFTASGTIPTPNTSGAICSETEMKADFPRIPKGYILTRTKYISYHLKDTYSSPSNTFPSPLQNY